jgi:hypothetical protein
MSYPLIKDYDLAVKNLSRFILADCFKGGTPIRVNSNGANSSKGELVAHPGGYSVVYPIIVNGTKRALRCWLKMPGNVKLRYTKAKEYFASNPSPYFVEFDYIEDGILIRGKKYPVSSMEWVEGSTLSDFLKENVNDSAALRSVASGFQVMVEELHRQRISHGDLQDGNIMVCRNGDSLSLKLVDYDSLFVPLLQSMNIRNELIGVAEYQHPRRSGNANEKADYFSELVIYLSLCAYAERPELWEKEHERRLLFTAKDFLNPGATPIYKTLRSMSPDIRHLTSQLEDFCRQHTTEHLRPLEALLRGGAGTPDDVYEYFRVSRDTIQLPAVEVRTTRGAGAPAQLQNFFAPAHETEQAVVIGHASTPPVAATAIARARSTKGRARLAPWAVAATIASPIFGALAWLLFGLAFTGLSTPLAFAGLSSVAALLAIATGSAARMLSASNSRVKKGWAIAGIIIGCAYVPVLAICMVAGLWNV